MKRFVTYIYEYDRGIRGKNVGFIRTDIRDNLCRMELHIRGLDRVKGKGKVYLAVYDNAAIGVPAGDILLSQGMGNLILTCPKNLLGRSGYRVSEIQAVVIRYGNGKLLISSFVNEPAQGILHGGFTEWTANPPAENTTRQDSKNMIQPVAENNRTDSVHTKIETAANSVQTEPTAATKTNVSSSGQTVAHSKHTAASYENTAADSEQNSPTQETGQSSSAEEPKPSADMTAAEAQPLETSYRRIEITDIRSLPKRNWYLCNNSFLVHGFFNYHYLILKTVDTSDGRKRFIGVPGIYEQPERMMALLFGFPEFEASKESKYSHAESANDSNGVFGYWMCPLAEE